MAETRWLLAWGLGSLAQGAASLLVPLYVVALGGGPVALGLLAGAAAFVGAPGGIVWGRLADRTRHRREVVTGSLGALALVLFALPALESVTLVVLANAVLWFVVSAAGPVLTLLVVADLPESEWPGAIARLNQYQGYGWAGGLVLGTVWTLTVGQFVTPLSAQRLLFVVCGVCAVGAAVGAVRWMPGEAAARLTPTDVHRVATLLSRRRRGVRGATFPVGGTRLYWSTRQLHPRRLAERFTPALAAYFAAVLLFFAGFFVFFAPLPLYLTEVGFGSGTVFALYLVSSLGAAASYVTAGELASRYDVRLLQVGGLGLRGLAFPAVALVGGALAATLPGLLATGVVFVLVGVAWALVAVTATTLVSRLAPPRLRGEALGVYTALGALAGGIGSVLGGWLTGLAGYPVTFGVAGLLVLAGAVFVGLLRGLSMRTSGHPGPAQSGPPGTEGPPADDRSERGDPD